MEDVKELLNLIKKVAVRLTDETDITELKDAIIIIQNYEVK